MWYGVSSIAARFISYALTPYITAVVSPQDYGRIGIAYAFISLMNIFFTYGMETGYFRFVQRQERLNSVNDTATTSLVVTSVILFFVLWMGSNGIANVLSLQDFPSIVKYCVVIIALDAITTIPFARLRQEGRPKLFAFIRVTGIFINIGLTIFFLTYCRKAVAADSQSWLNKIYDPHANPVIYILIANIAQAAFAVLVLSPKLIPKKWKFDWGLWREMMIYALPMLIAGLGGMINETFDRIMLARWLPGSHDHVVEQVGIYNACYKLSILISLFIQAFRMGAEPFFFKQAEGKNAQYTYARVMKFFVITICLMFLVVSLYIPLWKHFIQNKKEWEGLRVVPILLFANMFLGIYYNLSVWYKVTSRTKAGAWITVIGALITIVINFFFIPYFGYMACAWATFLCYGSMMVISYVWGQKQYYVPYSTKKLLAYLGIVAMLYFIHKTIIYFVPGLTFSLVLATFLTGGFFFLIFGIERKEFRKLPVIGRYL
ncbi:MAG: polysaccharide biosynthesis protein [Chitinophagaceae bacterium]|nr:polysaccharide biosynthesis protein [Chitinophagaceae bacterium]